MATQPRRHRKDTVPGRLEIGNKTGKHTPTQCRFCGAQLNDHDRVRRYPDSGPAGSWCYEYQCANDQEALDWSAVYRPYLHGE